VADPAGEGRPIMIARDLELLSVVGGLNADMGNIVTTLLEHMVDGQLPAHKLRELAEIARDLAEALDQRAEEIDPSDTMPRVIDGDPQPPELQREYPTEVKDG